MSLETALYLTRAQPLSHDKLFALLNIAVSHHALGSRLADRKNEFVLVTVNTLNEALGVAEKLGDQRGESYALGYLGNVYEGEDKYDEALQLSRRAVFAAQQANAPESRYRWEWQWGRVLKKIGKLDQFGIWYDAVSTVSEMIDAFPTDPLPGKQRASLLEQVRLSEVAGQVVDQGCGPVSDSR